MRSEVIVVLDPDGTLLGKPGRLVKLWIVETVVEDEELAPLLQSRTCPNQGARRLFRFHDDGRLG